MTERLYADPNMPSPWETELHVPRLIGLSGYAQVGKDTVGHTLTEMFGHKPISFSDKLREFMYQQHPIYLHDGNTLRAVVDQVGWEQARLDYPEIRELQQTTGTNAGRNVLYDMVWVDASCRDMKDDERYVFTSVRFPNEAKKIKRLGGIIIRIQRPGVGPVNTHPSDRALDDWPFDAYISNDGTVEDLRFKVFEVIEELNGG